mmetsp:Transcript_32375/g.29188  ORF Transcript_32375/g.29188 Transcript_32375/m.29188 type:complete len:253 (+) Transcript_32375:38-796(+)|eukprot:CAMPEP_0114581808 /NCGR_PEP_ID=MMETSP0125-20121206/5881_1 /TAXON_ID=485358 ORGANISM="Aristerostoma sp., Strain ATCC 50986" /NCGR_SAMPLE_ID=MMETSP0125 /ASSEMBLY_ACC=CAM_ASM_000245 /LENGTH=252 /DNA_ID=CAMNT_0001774315 /DNA_START=33 /DNA_END=791 /DNA_ORIENTATION=-
MVLFDSIVHLFGFSTNLEDFYANREATQQLVANGFSLEEAQNLLWLNDLKNRGKMIGSFAGIFSFFALGTWTGRVSQFFPILRWRSGAQFALRALSGLAVYAAFDYYYTSPARRTGDSQFSRLYNNNEYVRSKEMFIRSFAPLNRKFSPEEIDFFYVRQHFTQDKPRRWHYNPHVHGDEQDYNLKIRLAENNRHVTELPEVAAKIAQENKEKVKLGIYLQDQPYNLNNFIDRTGRKAGITKLPGFQGWQPLN